MWIFIIFHVPLSEPFRHYLACPFWARFETPGLRDSSRRDLGQCRERWCRRVVDEGSYLQLAVGKLNFWEDLTLLFKPSFHRTWYGGIRKAWDTSIMAKSFRELASQALTLITEKKNLDRSLVSSKLHCCCTIYSYRQSEIVEHTYWPTWFRV